jgi:DNA-directed RNA polymerase specialized sigma24 family protein
VAGDTEAWGELFATIHPRLVKCIRAFLRIRPPDYELIDEIAARTWAAMYRRDCQLLNSYDPSRAALITLFNVVAKTETRMLIRSEKRIRNRQLIACVDEATTTEVLPWEDLQARLSPREREFLSVLLGHSEDAGITPANRWQLRSRIKKKLIGMMLEG